MFYWELILKDDTRYEIPPDVVDVVTRKMKAHDPVALSTATVPYSEIKHFRITNKPYGQQPLLEAAAQAFNEPVINEDGSIAAKWVKQLVTQREYARYYAAQPSYRSLGDEAGMVIVAHRLPVHQIDSTKVDYCTDDEISSLTRQ